MHKFKGSVFNFGSEKILKAVGQIVLIATFIFTPVAKIFAQTDSLKLVQKDSRVISPRYPSKAHLEEFLNDRDYQYKDDPTPPGNPLAKWMDWIMRKISAFFNGEAYVNFWQYVIMASVAILVVYLLYKAGVLKYIFPSKEKSDPNDYIVGQENIHEINFEQAISDALSSGDYRLAIRMRYLQTLKNLSSQELIHWQPNRTNHSFIQELERYPGQEAFIQITRYFEFAWYGDFPISAGEYQEMKDLSDSFHAKLNRKSYV